MNTFSYQNNIKNIQNQLIVQNIRASSNLELLTSEEAIKNVIKSYTDRFQAIGGMLLDVKKYIITSKEIIKKDMFNDLFESIFIDLTVLYSDLNMVDEVLSLNLQRNKSYFAAIKKRIIDLWNKLALTRSYIHDSDQSDESYYEAFNIDINAVTLKNLIVDKKNGFMYLKPDQRYINNKPIQIKTVSSITYPVANDNGGVFYTTNPLNTFIENYTNGPRDMLQNGLWKEELLTYTVPDLSINIGSSGIPIIRNYKGIVSIIDIEYCNSIEFNRIDFDIYGDKAINIDCILYKEYENDTWKIVNYIPDDPLATKDNIYDVTIHAATGHGFDIVTINNIEKIKAKYLRIVLNQEHYTFLSSDSLSQDADLEQQINTDLSNRRYDLIKFGSNLNDMLSRPVNDENVSLYNSIMDVIESTSNINGLLKQIENILIPQTKVISYDFMTTIKFEIGLWSIEPILEQYTNSNGIYQSIPYNLYDKALISASILTGQNVPSSNTCNWYIQIKNNTIPIIENNNIYRKESINAIDMSQYGDYSTWNSGTFVLLDFPIDPSKTNEIGIYINDDFSTDISNRIAFLNSRLLFIKDIIDSNRAYYTVRYPSAFYNSINLYVLKPSLNGVSSNIPLGIVSSRKAILEYFIKNTYYINTEIPLSTNFIVTNAISTKEEAEIWFGSRFNQFIFISDLTKNQQLVPFYFCNYACSVSKIQSTYNDLITYYNGSDLGNADLRLLSSLANIAPIPINRII